jgi:Tfp pilus assembly protein PilE
VSRTRFLVAIAIAAVLMQVYPAYVGAIKRGLVLLGVTYLLVRALKTYPRLYQEKKRQAAQNVADAQEYLDYARELETIRSTFDPNHHDGADVDPPPEYQDALTALSEKHRDMLTRKFGAY